MTSEFTGQKIAVLGLAATGLATARVLRDQGAFVTIYDSKPETALDPARVAESRALDGVRLALGTSDLDWAETDLIVPSPGVPRYAPPLVQAVERGVPILGEIEVAYRLAVAPILAITGTNGKTTTTALLGAICREAGLKTWVAGNIAEDAGVRLPLIQAAIEAPEDGVIVAEISSFQLEWVEKFRPRVAAWLNISVDHFDRHKDMDEYARAKANIFRAQTKDDFAILNGDDKLVMRYGWEVGAGIRGAFHTKSDPGEVGAFADSAGTGILRKDRLMYFRPGLAKPRIFPPLGRIATLGELQVKGAHNAANVLAASLMAMCIGIDPEVIHRAVIGFRGVAHRMEFVREIGGVRYINNSMCTNPAAVAASLEAVGTPMVAIAGGIHKGGDLSPMAESLTKYARHIVLIGQSKQEIAEALRTAGQTRIEFADTLPDAVNRAAALAQPGETVILIPGCASFDMFTGFEQRGQVFRDAVQTLGEGGTL